MSQTQTQTQNQTELRYGMRDRLLILDVDTARNCLDVRDLRRRDYVVVPSPATYMTFAYFLSQFDVVNCAGRFVNVPIPSQRCTCDDVKDVLDSRGVIIPDVPLDDACLLRDTRFTCVICPCTFVAYVSREKLDTYFRTDYV